MNRALCLLAIFAGGCASSAPPLRAPELPFAAPASQTVGEELARNVEPDWWREFADPGLNRVIARALESSYDLAAASARVAQAEAQARIDASGLYPQAAATLNNSRRKQNFIGFPIPGREGEVLSTTATTRGVNVQVSWEVDLWSRLSAAARASIAGYQATAAELAGVRISIAGQTSKAWFAAAEAREQLRLAEATYASFVASTEQVRERYEAGIRSSLDYRLSLANTEAARANVLLRRQQLDLARRQLEILVATYPEGAIETPESLIPVPAAVPAGLASELVARRPDLTAAERRLVASGELVAVAKRARYPRLSLTASGGTSSRALVDLLDGDFSVWSLVGNLLQPIFEGGRLRANVERAEASEEESLAGYVRAVLNAYLEVERSLAADSFLAEREAALTEAAEQSRAAERLADERYRQGVADYITVLESQRRAFDAESALIAVRRLRLDNRVDLYLALGGGFQRESVLPRVADTEHG